MYQRFPSQGRRRPSTEGTLSVFDYCNAHLPDDIHGRQCRQVRCPFRSVCGCSSDFRSGSVSWGHCQSLTTATHNFLDAEVAKLYVLSCTKGFRSELTFLRADDVRSSAEDTFSQSLTTSTPNFFTISILYCIVLGRFKVCESLYRSDRLTVGWTYVASRRRLPLSVRQSL